MQRRRKEQVSDFPIFVFLFDMQKRRKAVLLINVGTPDKPKVKQVRRYLSHFLNDRRVIDMPWFFRKLLVNLLIVPFRAPKSAKLYQNLWTSEGSPLLLNMEKFAGGLHSVLGEDYRIFTAMRYGNPSLKKALQQMKNQNFDELIVFPLFPQYASSTTGTILEFVMDKVKRWQVIPKLRFISQFYDHPEFVEAFTQNIAACQPEEFDHIIFSYHGLPLRQVDKIHPGISSAACLCEKQMPAYGSHCYKATCYETTRLIAEKLGLTEKQYSVSFQSRLTKNWLGPFTDERIKKLADEGAKKILVTVPSFVTDCLETLVEIEAGYDELFRKFGGEKLVLVKSLNDSEQWVKTAADIIRTKSR
ncbi:MAG: ferrochelatase [bacterium]|nr:MAG: ferrochelatase [bacterium]